MIWYLGNIKKEDYKEKYKILDEEDTEAIWVDINRFKNKEQILYPEQVFKYLG